MAEPVTDCIMYKAAIGTEEDYQTYINLLIENIKTGRLSQISCSCNPPCERPSKEQSDAFSHKLENEPWWPAHKRKEYFGLEN